MSKASLSSGNGPGSSIILAPETIRVRDALIEKFNGAPLEEMNNFMTMALSSETDEFRRLGILAARIYILRNRVANLKEFNRNPSLSSLAALDTTTLNLNLPSVVEPTTTEDGEVSPDTDNWSRIQMTEPGEVNGVRFLAGTIIDAQTVDADKLIRSGKAVRIDTDGNTTEHNNDDFTDNDASANNDDEATQTVDDDISTPTELDDDISALTTSNDASVSDKVEENSNFGADTESEAGTKDAETQTANSEDENQKAPTSS